MTRQTRHCFSVSTIVAIGVLLVACSGSSPSGVTGPAPTTETFPCCSGGYIYKCATESALGHCSNAKTQDTTDCTKTATACGGEAGPEDGAAPDAGRAPAPTADKKAAGAKCTLEAECAGGLCLSYGGGDVGFCSNTCASKSDCPTDYRCELLPDGVKACVTKGEAKLGDTSTWNMNCESDLCLVAAGATTGYCTAPCTVAAECPAGWSCSSVGGASGTYCQRP
jgi:hypothetical protein